MRIAGNEVCLLGLSGSIGPQRARCLDRLRQSVAATASAQRS